MTRPIRPTDFDFYKRMWDETGYGKRWARVMATNAPMNRKQAAVARIWARTVEKL